MLKSFLSLKSFGEVISLIEKRFYWHRMSYRPRHLEPGAYPFPRKQVPVEGLKSFSERIKDLSISPVASYASEQVNIGFKCDAGNQKSTVKRQQKTELEALARRRLLKVPLDPIHDTSTDVVAPMRRMCIAKHYGIYNDLFGSTYYFYPIVELRVYFALNDASDHVQPVYCGNYISSENAKNEPLFDFSHLSAKHLWTLVLTCPDEPLSDNANPQQSECIHWMVCNINPELEDGTPKEGDLIVDYFPPLPYHGTGFHRYVFILYRQDNGRIDFSHERRGSLKGDPSKERIFSTEKFYRENQDNLTPAGMAFFQSSWDTNVRSYIREHLTDYHEPIFEARLTAPLPPPQSRFPIANSWPHARRHPLGFPLAENRLGVHEDVSFDIYLDRYRDRKELHEEIVRERLAAENNPLDPSTATWRQPEFPMAVPFPEGMPSWYRKKETQKRLRQGHWSGLEGYED